MASTWFSLLLVLVASRRNPVSAHQAQVYLLGENEHAQSSVRLPRGLLDGLVGAVLSPVLGVGEDGCSSARGDSVSIGATLPLGISAGISGSSADANGRPRCGASAGSNSAGVNSGSGSAASAGGSGYGAAGSGAADQAARASHGSQAHGGYRKGHHQSSFNGESEAMPSGSAGNEVGWGSQSGSHEVSGSAGQIRPGIASNGPGNGNGFSNNGEFVGGAPVRGGPASGSASSSQSASMGHDGPVPGEHVQGNLGNEFSGSGSGYSHGYNTFGAGSPDVGGRGQVVRRDGLNEGRGSEMIKGILSASSSASRASSSSGTFVGAPPGASHSSSRSDANSSSRSNSFVIST